MNQMALRRKMVEYCQLVWKKGWVANHDGNITMRLDSKRILATPTAISKREIKEDDLLIIDLKTLEVISGHLKPFSELYMHQEYYLARPDVKAVIHVHPTTLCSFSVAGIEVEPKIMPEPVVSIGDRIPLTAPAMPKSLQAKHQIRALAPLFDVILLGNHGPVSCGVDLEMAFLRMELAEHIAEIQQKAIWLGQCRLIPDAHRNDLMKARTKAGLGPDARGQKLPPAQNPSNAPVEDLISSLVEKLK